MSLDVYLTADRMVTCPHCQQDHAVSTGEEVFSANITHNLNKMADAAGIYQACWRPEEVGIAKAGELIPLLENGIKQLRERPEYFQQYDSANGWGLYVHFLPWLENYLAACKEYPDATIRVRR